MRVDLGEISLALAYLGEPWEASAGSQTPVELGGGSSVPLSHSLSGLEGWTHRLVDRALCPEELLESEER